MRRFFAWMAFVVALLAGPAAAQAGVTVQVNLSTQRMTVTEDGKVKHNWAVSSGRRGYRTPTGTYGAGHMATMHRSRKYHMAPMPHSIFFRGGYAIHGTGEVGRLGRTASHGCIRLSRGNAAQLFKLVQGRKAETRIVITGDAEVADAGGPGAKRVAVKAGPKPRATLAKAGSSKPKLAVRGGAKGGGKALAKRQAPGWSDGSAYGFAPVSPSPLDAFWEPRGYQRR